MARRFGFQALKTGTDRMPDVLAELRALLELFGAAIGAEPSPPDHPMPHGHVATELTEDGIIRTPFGTPSREVSDAIMGMWPRDLWTDAARVAYLEADHWSPTAERNTLSQAGGRCGVRIGTIRGVSIVSEDSVGLFQINVCAWPWTREQMLDPRQNAAAGYHVYRAQGWRAWQFTADTLGLLGG